MYYYENYEFLTKGRKVLLFITIEEQVVGVIKEVLYDSPTSTYGRCVVELNDGRIKNREFEDMEALFTKEEVMKLNEEAHMKEIEPDLYLIETTDMDGNYYK
jgi:hypothetical protein